jgi:D-beta-D-heptose 7-phosphate kinase/D-beta-D-heptose 1-phosphate adenosyltransferase
VLDRAGARRWRDAQRGVVVFTNGVFDLLHPGHVDVLTAARAEGDALIVGVNSDASVRRLKKGAERPIRPEADRAYILAALGAVDAVVLFEENTPQALIEWLQPNVLVKGGDYTEDSVVGADVVRSTGGRVVIVPLTAGQSTTAIVERLRGRRA